MPYTEEELTGLAESFLRDFPFREFPYLMEHVRQLVADRPQGRRLAFGLDLTLDGVERMV